MNILSSVQGPKPQTLKLTHFHILIRYPVLNIAQSLFTFNKHLTMNHYMYTSTRPILIKCLRYHPDVRNISIPCGLKEIHENFQGTEGHFPSGGHPSDIRRLEQPYFCISLKSHWNCHQNKEQRYW